jgi:hypothetical protein
VAYRRILDWVIGRIDTSGLQAITALRCIATEVIRLLIAYSLPRECVYRVVV